jgi:ribosomal protein S18 acetylase RimI-like enzyme
MWLDLPRQRELMGPISVFVQSDPEDDSLAAFDSGSTESAMAINAFIRGAKWLQFSGAVALRFEMVGEVCAFAVVRLTRENHPAPGAPDRAPYLSIYALGVQVEFQGLNIQPGGNRRTVADVVLETCEAIARQEGAAGLRLLVRPNNAAAIRLYERHRLVVEPGGPLQDRRGVQLVAMRKVLA